MPDDEKLAIEPEDPEPELEKIPDSEAEGMGYENDPIEDEEAGV